MKKTAGFLLLSMIVTSIAVFAQNDVSRKTKSELFPSATFAVGFEKFFENPLFSWRADTDANIVGYRKGSHNLSGRVKFSTVGAKPMYGRVNIAGTAYGLEACYKYFRTEKNWVSVCNSHLSSHKAAELSGLAKEEKERGRHFPTIDTVDLNLISFSTGFLLVIPTEPEFTLRFQPISFHYGGSAGFYHRPVYLVARLKLIKGRYAKLSLVTKQELGVDSFNDGYLTLDFFSHGQKEGRTQIYIGYSPNHQVQPSVNEMIRRGGFKIGIRLIWEAH